MRLCLQDPQSENLSMLLGISRASTETDRDARFRFGNTLSFNPAETSYDEKKKEIWKEDIRKDSEDDAHHPVRRGRQERALDHCDRGSRTSDLTLYSKVPDKGISCAIYYELLNRHLSLFIESLV